MSNLLLDSLEIKNFRAFKHLRIEKLGRVNLIVGKNNVGKSSVLEAVRLYAQRGDPSLLWDMIEERDESSSKHSSYSRISSEDVLNLRHLFYGRGGITTGLQHIQIGPLQPQESVLSIAITWREVNDPDVTIRQFLDGKNDLEFGKRRVLVIQAVLGPDSIYVYSLESNASRSPLQPSQIEKISTQFVSSVGLQSHDVTHLWDQIALTDWEEEVVTALKLISLKVERLNLVAIDDEDRIPVVRMAGISSPVPLRSLGEGMYRMLGIALALVSARDGFLLVDEIESGLHYSVQADMWRLVFAVAQRLNIQVFATKHSLDCIRAFQYAANENSDEAGILIRLAQRGEEIIATSFDEEDLAIIARDEIEVR